MNFLKKLYQMYFGRDEMKSFLEGDSCVRIIDTIERVDFFDGLSTQLNCAFNESYSLGSSDAEIFMKSHISFMDKKGKIIIITVCGFDECIHKSISTWLPPNSGFFEEDFLKLVTRFGLGINNETSETMYAKSGYGYHLKLHIKFESDKIYFLIYDITGGRAPEGVYLVGLYEVLVTEKFRNRYLLGK